MSRAPARGRAPAPAIEEAALPSLRRYLWANRGLSFAIGIQHVLFSWLLAGPLGVSGTRLGIAQATFTLSGLSLILVGGVVAERSDPRRRLARLHAIGALLPLALAAVIAADWLRYETMIAYALAMGALQALIGPGRDVLLSRVAGGAIARVVAMQMTAMWTGQLAGFVLASLVRWSGAPAALGVQALALLFAAAMYARLEPPVAHAGEATGRSPWREIGDALRTTLDSPALRPALAMQLAIGVLLGGTWVVITQLLVRDVYGGDAFETALCFAAMMIGTMSATLAVSRRGGVHRQGRATIAAFLASGLVTLLLATTPRLPVALGVIVVWGVCNGLAVTMPRTIAQERAPVTHRARVLSLFQLALMAGAPVGSLAIGAASTALGPARALWLPASGLIATALIAAFASALPRVEALSAGTAGAEPVPRSG